MQHITVSQISVAFLANLSTNVSPVIGDVHSTESMLTFIADVFSHLTVTAWLLTDLPE